jgi:hypothetical protein
MNAASKAFNIPLSTLSDKIRGQTPVQVSPKTVLSREEELKIVAWLQELSKRGFGNTRDDLKNVAKTILDSQTARQCSQTTDQEKTGYRHFSGATPSCPKGDPRH